MAPSENFIYWEFGGNKWLLSASEILNEQCLEDSEHIQKSAFSMPSVQNAAPAWPGLGIFWIEGASTILNEQAVEEAQKNASSQVLSY